RLAHERAPPVLFPRERVVLLAAEAVPIAAEHVSRDRIGVAGVRRGRQRHQRDRRPSEPEAPATGRAEERAEALLHAALRSALSRAAMAMKRSCTSQPSARVRASM